MKLPRATTLMVLGAALLTGGMAPGCERSPQSHRTSTLTVYAAASLADAFREIGGAFEAANPGARVEFSFAGSNQLRTQLEQGAPADVFVSADRRQMDGAVASGVVDATTVIVIAHNELAILVPRENPGGIDALADLARAGLTIVVADRSVPVGHSTRLMLEAARASSDLGPAFVDAFDVNTVSHEENVAAVVAKVGLNEADAGIAYVTDGAGRNRSRVMVVAIPPGLNHRSEDVAGVGARAPDPVLGARFLAFMRSDVAAAILVDHGFIAPDPGSP